MTGKRLGNPQRVRSKRRCARCHDVKFMQGRELCVTCWVKAKHNGTLADYPTRAERSQQGCQCFVPVVELGELVCKRCKRAVVR